MRRVKALELLEDGAYCMKLGMASYHQLLLDAGCSPEEAQRLTSEHGMERLNAGLKL